MRDSCSAGMPEPVSATSTTAPSSSIARDDRQPAALRHRVARVEEQVQEHLLQLVLDALHDRRRRRELLAHLDAAGLELVLEQRQHVVDDGVDVARAAVDLRRPRQVQQAVDDLRGAERLPLDLLEHLASSDRPGSAPSSSICVKLEMPVSGVFTSCATPAASRPIDAIFSEICSCSSSCTRVEMSSTMTIVPAIVAVRVAQRRGRRR